MIYSCKTFSFKILKYISIIYQVLGKNRQVHAVNACLSPEKEPTLMAMSLSGCAQVNKLAKNAYFIGFIDTIIR